MVIAKLKQNIRKILENNPQAYPDFEANQLLAWGLGESYFILPPDEEVSSETEEKITQAAIKRVKGEPLQYIIGEWEFYGYRFKLGEGVLIPRQETELLVEKVLPFVNKDSIVIDLCSGSGCIPVAISKKSGAKCYGVEISEEAASYFTQNIILNNCENKVFCIQGDVLNTTAELLEKLPKKCQVITANPPYLTAEEMENLQKEVRHEPELALYGGNDGLDYYRVIFEKWKGLLEKDGIFAVETGDSQGGKVKDIMEASGFECTIYSDYHGIQRLVAGKIRQ